MRADMRRPAALLDLIDALLWPAKGHAPDDRWDDDLCTAGKSEAMPWHIVVRESQKRRGGREKNKKY